jgi:NitT/TauT family transport system ATP-binding protein
MKFRRARASTVVTLEHIDLALARGEFLSVLGPLGCGKSTLLRLAAARGRQVPAHCCKRTVVTDEQAL